MTSPANSGQVGLTYLKQDGENCLSVCDSGIDSFRSSGFDEVDHCPFLNQTSYPIHEQFQDLTLKDKDCERNYSCPHRTARTQSHGKTFVSTCSDQGFDEEIHEDQECYSTNVESFTSTGYTNIGNNTQQSIDNLFSQDEDGDTQLHIAIIKGMSDVALSLTATATHPVYLDTSNDMKQTPLHLAAITNQPQIMKQLLNCGANGRIQDRHGNTPLHLAGKSGHIECVQELIKPNRSHQVDINAVNYDGYTCLHVAGLEGKTQVLEYLLRCGADKNAHDATGGRTLLHHAVERNDVSVVRLLCGWPGVNIDQPTWYSGSTPYQIAQERGFTEVAQILAAAGADTSSLSFESSDSPDSSMDESMEEFTDFVINGMPL